MTDWANSAEGSTNGRHAVMDGQNPPIGTAGQNAQSVDERLAALLQTIQRWDWRTAFSESELSSGSATTSTVTSLTTVASFEAGEDSASTPNNSFPSHAAVESPQIEAVEDAATRAGGSTWRAEPALEPRQATNSRTWGSEAREDPPTLALDQVLVSQAQAEVAEPAAGSAVTTPPTGVATSPPGLTVPAEQPPAPCNEQVETHSETAEIIVQRPPSTEGTASDNTEVNETAWFVYETEPEPEPHGLLHRWESHPAARFLQRLWSNPTTKLIVFVFSAIVIVLLIIVGIRHFAGSSGSAGPTVTTTTRPHSHGVTPSHFVAPISSTELTQYEGYASAFQSGNQATSAVVANAGNAPTGAQLELALLSYRTVLNVYKLDLAVLQWPASMQTAIGADTTELQQLATYVQSFGTVGPTGVSTWLSQFRTLANTAQTDDNVVRQDLGLPASSTFP